MTAPTYEKADGRYHIYKSTVVLPKLFRAEDHTGWLIGATKRGGGDWVFLLNEEKLDQVPKNGWEMMDEEVGHPIRDPTINVVLGNSVTSSKTVTVTGMGAYDEYQTNELSV